MKELLTIILIYFLVLYPLEKLRQKMLAKEMKELEEAKKPKCPPHKWMYDHLGNMMCNNCKNKPGYHKSSNGEYGQ